MPFINFLYANLMLGAPAGMEDKVTPIHACKCKEHITGFYQFSPEELAEINKVGGFWISFMSQKWPPVKIDAYIPAHNPTDVLIFGPEMPNLVKALCYLDLTLFLLTVEPDERDFKFRQRLGEGTMQDGKPCDIYDLEFLTQGGDFVHRGDKYLFGEALEVAGRFDTLERLHPLRALYPFLNEPGYNPLVLMPKEKPQSRLVDFSGHKLN